MLQSLLILVTKIHQARYNKIETIYEIIELLKGPVGQTTAVLITILFGPGIIYKAIISRVIEYFIRRRQKYGYLVTETSIKYEVTDEGKTIYQKNWVFVPLSAIEKIYDDMLMHLALDTGITKPAEIVAEYINPGYKIEKDAGKLILIIPRFLKLKEPLSFGMIFRWLLNVHEPHSVGFTQVLSADVFDSPGKEGAFIKMDKPGTKIINIMICLKKGKKVKRNNDDYKFWIEEKREGWAEPERWQKNDKRIRCLEVIAENDKHVLLASIFNDKKTGTEYGIRWEWE